LGVGVAHADADQVGRGREVVVARERLRVREISSEEGNRLLRIVRRSSGSVVTWRRAQMVLLSAQGMDVEQIAKVAFSSPDRVREAINNFNDDGFESLYPKYSGWPAADVHAAAAPEDQEDRTVPTAGSRASLLDVEPEQAGRVLGG